MRKSWGQLSEPYRRRLERSGITRQAYESGASLKAARGHSTTPERPSRAFRNPDLYGGYLRRRVAKGKPVPEGIIAPPEAPSGGQRIIGDEIGWPGRHTLYMAVITRARVGSAEANQPGTITLLRANPQTGDWTETRVIEYDQADFIRYVRMIRERGFVVQVISTTHLGVTA